MINKIDEITKIVKAGGEIALKYFGNVEREEKDIGNLVTIADREVEKFLKSEISKLFPDDGFIGEEEGFKPGISNRIWIIDPIDGTADFANKLPSWGSSLALFVDGKPELGIVYLPVVNKFFKAFKGKGSFCNDQAIRIREGKFDPGNFYAKNAGAHLQISTDLNLRVVTLPCALSPCAVAEGAVLGSVMLPCYIWDYAAGLLIAKEAGASYRYLSGKEFDFSSLMDGSSALEFLLCGSKSFIEYAEKHVSLK